ncbi:hypothetical protein MELE44368_11340 [Mycolicibacterium elephantis DSM 44368]|uniref:Uncharacterized protein n=1 Tax=Mycolicibacterium elephantis DSM 44368 TaxID=1335622 RepID=A0A439DYP3_9MYCO|nr:hypothetical protein MELE44368_11340 [Mycolicibacterium elephantis DSM 44368]
MFFLSRDLVPLTRLFELLQLSAGPCRIVQLRIDASLDQLTKRHHAPDRNQRPK